MAQHATIHGKTTESWNGQDGKWIPIRTDANGAFYVNNNTAISGEMTGIGRLAGGMIVNYALITTSTTTVVKAGQALYAGLFVVVAGVGSAVSVYDNTAAAGNQLVIAEATTTKGKVANDAVFAGEGIIMNTGLTVVTTGATPATILVYWA